MTQHEWVAEQWMVLLKLAERRDESTEREDLVEALDDPDSWVKQAILSHRESYAMGYLRGAAEVMDVTLSELLDQTDGLPERPS